MNSDYEMTWSVGEKTKVFCSGPQNSLLLASKDIAEIECVSGKKFKVDGKEINFNNVVCTNKITGDVKETSQVCGNGAGKLKYVGFEGQGNMFVPFIKTCYKTTTGSVLYTRHLLHGDAVFTGCVTEPRQDFRLDGTAPQCATLAEYSVLNKQKDRFTKQSAILGARFNDNDRLVRGHLTSYCDALFPTWKQATQFYVNTAPEWKKVNNANWKRVEAMSRGIAKELKKTLEIYSGTFGILNLDNVDMTLMDNGFVEVPKYFWKIIRDPATDQGIALVTLNNIFATSVPTICPDICKATNWDHANFDDYRRGFTYCCDVSSLRSVVPHIPSEASSSSRLMYKSPTTTTTTSTIVLVDGGYYPPAFIVPMKIFYFLFEKTL